MGQFKIKTIQPNGTYDSQNGMMYKFEIQLESGDSGEVSAKSEDRWSVGDETDEARVHSESIKGKQP